VPVIEVNNISKVFSGKTVVNNLSLQVEKGEIFGFLGPNGSGKTTTIRMLCGLLIPDSGTGQCLGYDILSQSSELKPKIGYMTQHFSLYSELTVGENLDFTARVYGLKNRSERVRDILNKFSFYERRNQLAGTLSGGWKQRLALAVALLHDPKLLLLDEPTAGVDPKARREFWDQIHELADLGITTLLSTHYMDEAERCNRIAYIAFGDLLVHGTIEEVVKKSKLVTWSVKGKDILSLKNKLQNLPGVEQVVAFGQSLHVSGSDSMIINESIQSFKTKDYDWQLISSNLEDVFISLVGGVKNN